LDQRSQAPESAEVSCHNVTGKGVRRSRGR
jgi:hypothetical protein